MEPFGLRRNSVARDHRGESAIHMTAVIPGPSDLAESQGMTNNHRIPAGPDPFGRFRLDHVRVLAQVDALEQRALAGQVLPGAGELREAVAMLARQFDTHMAAEDAVLYPAVLAAFPAGRSILEALCADHVELRLMLATIQLWLERPESSERTEQLQVVLRDLVDLLRLHVRREESAVFDVATRVLTERESAEITHRIAPYVTTEPNCPVTPEPGVDDPGYPKGLSS